METPRIRYYLENQKRLLTEDRNKKEPIMVEINYKYVRFDKKGKKRYVPFRISLKGSILPERFGLVSSNFKFDNDVFKKATRNNASIRTKISRLEIAIDKLVDRYELKEVVPSPEKFKNDLLIELGRNKKIEEQEKGILDYLYEKINKGEKDSTLNKRNSLSLNTIKTYKTVSHLIENYQIATKEILTFENFDKDKYWNFWDILNDILNDEIKISNPNQPRKQIKQDYGYLVSTVRKYQSTLIRTMKDALEDNIVMTLNVFDKNLILEKSEASKDIYVTENELLKIIEFNVGDDEEMKMAKEYFIIGSLTGMRYESMRDTKNSKVETYAEEGYNFEYIHSKQNKTSTEVFIPLLALVKDILAKTNNEFPEVKSNPVINARLKKLFKFLEIDSLEDVTLKTYRSGEIKLKKPKYEIVTTHDCKKTFYTNLYKNKVNPTAIDNITHPDATPKNRMAKIYNKTNMLDKAKMFVDEIYKIESEIYKF